MATDLASDAAHQVLRMWDCGCKYMWQGSACFGVFCVLLGVLVKDAGHIYWRVVYKSFLKASTVLLMKRVETFASQVNGAGDCLRCEGPRQWHEHTPGFWQGAW